MEKRNAVEPAEPAPADPPTAELDAPLEGSADHFGLEGAAVELLARALLGAVALAGRRRLGLAGRSTRTLFAAFGFGEPSAGRETLRGVPETGTGEAAAAVCCGAFEGCEEDEGGGAGFEDRGCATLPAGAAAVGGGVVRPVAGMTVATACCTVAVTGAAARVTVLVTWESVCATCAVVCATAWVTGLVVLSTA